jgi:hypothetical protein
MSQGFTRGTPIDTDPNLALDSDLVVPSQKAVKTYVDNGLNTKQDAITLTTTGTSGAATLTGATLNIPIYGGGSGGNSIQALTGDVTASASSPSQSVAATLDANYKEGSFGVTFDGGGALITSGKIAYVRVPYKGTITGWQLVADQSGSCSIAVKQGVFSPFPPSTTIITAALSGTQTISGTISVAVAANDWFSFTITGTSAVQQVNLSISITKII